MSAFTAQLTGLVAAPRVAPKQARASVVCAASSQEARRAALSLAAAAGVSLSVVSSAFAADAPLTTLPTLQDDTKRNAGVQLIYEARDLDIDAKPRSDAPSRFAFQKLTTAETKARATESLARIQGPLGSYVSKSYWTQAFNELRRQVGTLRFDLNNLVEQKGSGAEEAEALYASIEKLDVAIRAKNLDKAEAAYATAAAAAAAAKAAIL